MSYLPSKYDSSFFYKDSPVLNFLKLYEPDDKVEAKKFREDLMKAINYYLPPSNKIIEHPDSLYLEP